jgi:hypothetical protein
MWSINACSKLAICPGFGTNNQTLAMFFTDFSSALTGTDTQVNSKNKVNNTK